jgi:hypothetical protein
VRAPTQSSKPRNRYGDPGTRLNIAEVSTGNGMCLGVLDVLGSGSQNSRCALAFPVARRFGVHFLQQKFALLEVAISRILVKCHAVVL